jgi:hypothetical protein
MPLLMRVPTGIVQYLCITKQALINGIEHDIVLVLYTEQQL